MFDLLLGASTKGTEYIIAIVFLLVLVVFLKLVKRRHEEGD